MKILRIIKLLPILIVMFMISNTVSAEPGLVGHWKLDEGSGTTAFDSSGNGNDGTLINDPIWTTGKLGNALGFDGINDELDFGNISFGSNDFTWVLWYKAMDLTRSEPIFGNEVHNGDPGMLLWHTTNPTGFRVSNGSGSWDTDINNNVSGNWQHLVLRRTGDLVKLFVDGNPSNFDGSGGALPAGENIDSGNNLKIGSWVGGKTATAEYDDVRVYNRALTSEEIQELFNMSNVAKVAVDCRPRRCPNILYAKRRYKKGTIPVAILGTEDFDVRLIDPTTITCNGVSPKKSRRYRDLSSPKDSSLELCDCDAFGPDTWEDLVLRFSKKRIIKSIIKTYGGIPDGEIEVEITGEFYDGTPFKGSDCLKVISNSSDDDSSGSDDDSSGSDDDSGHRHGGHRHGGHGHGGHGHRRH